MLLKILNFLFPCKHYWVWKTIVDQVIPKRAYTPHIKLVANSEYLNSIFLQHNKCNKIQNRELTIQAAKEYIKSN